ncbi:proline--tRNA ligase [uncultured Hymenobacter sp.]|uniref:proline--tRNA ligase n=1 Tax=uncultured Hymenobacter sp. TaxID=170016 RepID=UPI0035CB5009
MSKKLPTRQEDYSLWYNDLVKRAGLAENSAVRGCMVIKPYGYAIWEKMQRQLDDMFKRTGHENAYFPLFVPKSLFEAEEKNAEGFAKECAVVTHYRLQSDPDNPGKLRVDPAAKLEEELVVRPTSEAIIWSTYKNWIQSYRDLPLLINQWANVVRWEMRTRLFLRTAEFLWQEGHTAHATAPEALAETRQMLDVYAEFVEEHMALPVVKGAKTENERFAGAEETYCIEALMQDGKALQAGTSHFLGQNFAKAFDVQFQTKEGGREFVWGTSWGVSTRLMGALVMAHSDDEGLVLPPRLAPIQVVIVPIYKTGELDALLERIRPIQMGLIARGISVKVDSRDTERPGFKFAEWELKGVPVRLAIGARDLDAGLIETVRRDTKEKLHLPLADIVQSVDQLLADIQTSIYQKARRFRAAHTHRVETYDEFKAALEGEGGFVLAHYDGTSETEEQIKTETKATVRCLAFGEPDEDGVCIVTGRPSARRAYFARAY